MKKTLAVIGMLSALAAVPAFAHDVDSDGNTTTATTKPVYHGDMAGNMIKKMDTNGDGVISADEHAAYGEKMFKEADTNGDGQLSKDEVTAYHAKQRGAWASKTHHGIGHRGSASDTNNVGRSDANPHPTKDKQDQDM